MFKMWLFVFSVACFIEASSALEKLPEKYLVTYGDPEAPIKITEYFSFQCPHCLALFRQDFKKIEERFIDSKKIFWTFHPIPTDLATVQGMVCLANLSESQRKLYLETLLTEIEANSPQLTALIMSKVMEIFNNPLPNLQDENFLEKTDAFMDAFNFLVQEEKILAVPTIEVNAKLHPKDVPDFDFVQSIIK